MFRTELAAGHGMLFVFSKPQTITMWMKNTYLPLDMIFIKKSGEILSIAENTTPLSREVISSHGEAGAVLEVPAGTAKRIGAAPGDRVTHKALP